MEFWSRGESRTAQILFNDSLPPDFDRRWWVRWPTRCWRFITSANISYILIPICVASKAAGAGCIPVFWLNFIALLLLVRLFIIAFENIVASLAERMHIGTIISGLVNSLLSNFMPLTIGLSCIAQGEVGLAQSFIIGSMISDMVLSTGLALLVGGIYNMRDEYGNGKRQKFAWATGRSFTLLMVFATALCALVSALDETRTIGNRQHLTVIISLACAVTMLCTHVIFLWFRYRTHINLFEGEYNESGNNSDLESEGSQSDYITSAYRSDIPQATNSIFGRTTPQSTSRVSAVILILYPCLAILAARYVIQCSYSAAQAIGISQESIGLILLPLIGNMPTLKEALLLASINRMDSAVRITLGSSVDIAYITLPVLIMVSSALKSPMTMKFGTFEIAELLTSTLLMGRIAGLGWTTYLEGSASITMYLIIALASFVLPA